MDPKIFDRKFEAPILCNKYAIDELLRRESLSEQKGQEKGSRSKSMPRTQSRTKDLYSPSPIPVPKRMHQKDRHRYLAPPLPPEDVQDDQEFIELEVPVKKVKRREKALPPSPRIMSPMGFAVHRQARLQHFDEETGVCDDDYDTASAYDAPVRPVPIWLCVFLVVGYIIGGAFYFTNSETWGFLDSAYFCFITLTTIGKIKK